MEIFYWIRKELFQKVRVYLKKVNFKKMVRVFEVVIDKARNKVFSKEGLVNMEVVNIGIVYR